MSTGHFGSRIKRNIDPALLRGEGAFVDDIPLANPLHAAFVRSPFARATIRSIDVAAAARPSRRRGGLYRREYRRSRPRDAAPHPAFLDEGRAHPAPARARRRLLCRPDRGDGRGGRPLHRRGRRGAGRGRLRAARRRDRPREGGAPTARRSSTTPTPTTSPPISSRSRASPTPPSRRPSTSPRSAFRSIARRRRRWNAARSPRCSTR